jgi:hypothetical protein
MLMNTVAAEVASPQSYSQMVKSDGIITQHPRDRHRANQLPTLPLMLCARICHAK